MLIRFLQPILLQKITSTIKDTPLEGNSHVKVSSHQQNEMSSSSLTVFYIRHSRWPIHTTNENDLVRDRKQRNIFVSQPRCRALAIKMWSCRHDLGDKLSLCLAGRLPY